MPHDYWPGYTVVAEFAVEFDNLFRTVAMPDYPTISRQFEVIDG